MRRAAMGLHTILFGLVGACAPALPSHRDATIAVAYEMPGGIEPVAGASATKALVTATDGRTTDRDRIGVFKLDRIGGAIADAYGIQTLVIRASNDVPETVRIAVERNLKAQGFWIGAGGATARVEVLRFSADFPIRFLGWGVAATVELRISVQNTANSTVFTKTYSGAASESDSSQADITMSMSKALGDSVSQMVSDKDFQTALFTAQKP